MLKGKVKMTLQSRSYRQHEHLRLTFSFGEGNLFTGAVRSENLEYVAGVEYVVDVDFFTVNREAYALIESKLRNEMNLVICEGNRIIGEAVLLSYMFDG
jgi:hypothetical protein